MDLTTKELKALIKVLDSVSIETMTDIEENELIEKLKNELKKKS